MFLELLEHYFSQNNSDFGKCTFVVIGQRPDSTCGEVVRTLRGGLLKTFRGWGSGIEELRVSEVRGDL